jgi:lipoprotein NlpI
MPTTLPLALTAALVLAAGAFGADTAAELLAKAKEALRDGDAAAAAKAADEAVKADPNNAEAHLVRGIANAALRNHDKAIDAFNKVIELDPRAAPAARNLRGRENFKTVKVKESIEDFDAFLKAEPKRAPEHWQRGISLYYAGRYKDGVEQFESHQTVNPQDVENAVWHYLCKAKAENVAAAQKSFIKITRDPRVPMKEIHALYAGTGKPEDVLAAAEAGKPTADELTERRFYAHLYLGLYHEAQGDAKKSLEHIKAAVEKYKIGHYMWDVADVHLKLRTKDEKK